MTAREDELERKLAEALGRIAALEAQLDPPRVRVEAEREPDRPFSPSVYRALNSLTVPEEVTRAMRDKIGDDVVRDIVADRLRGR
jgi:hypothetical protein